MSTSFTHGRKAIGKRSRRSRWLPVRVWLHRRSLKRALAAGADPGSSPELAYRAEQLTSHRCRRALAASLHRTLREALEPPAPFTAAVPLQRREILEARDDIERLAQDLLAPGDMPARGVVLVQDLLTQGSSPLFTPGPEGQLERAVRQARAALLLG
jgi:hypothetical protein